MMSAVSINKLPNLIQKLKRQSQSIVLVGGCFDVLHPGHVIFLEKAKAEGDILIILLESDQRVQQLKGINRPVHNQRERAKVLSGLKSVDYIVLLPFIDSEGQYDQIVSQIKPAVLAVTAGDSNSYHHQRSAKLVGAKLKYVTKMIGEHSTSKILDR